MILDEVYRFTAADQKTPRDQCLVGDLRGFEPPTESRKESAETVVYPTAAKQGGKWCRDGVISHGG